MANPPKPDGVLVAVDVTYKKIQSRELKSLTPISVSQKGEVHILQNKNGSPNTANYSDREIKLDIFYPKNIKK